MLPLALTLWSNKVIDEQSTYLIFITYQGKQNGMQCTINKWTMYEAVGANTNSPYGKIQVTQCSWEYWNLPHSKWHPKSGDSLNTVYNCLKICSRGSVCTNEQRYVDRYMHTHILYVYNLNSAIAKRVFNTDIAFHGFGGPQHYVVIRYKPTNIYVQETELLAVNFRSTI